jgi:hypothetical protein
MATWISAQQRSLLGYTTGSLGYGSSSTIGVASLDHYSRVRLLAASDSSSFFVSFQQGQDSGTWLMSQGAEVASSAAYEYDCMGRVGLATLTMGASASMLRAYIYALPI